jgi:hypothetical protein
VRENMTHRAQGAGKINGIQELLETLIQIANRSTEIGRMINGLSLLADKKKTPHVAGLFFWG